MTQKKRKVGNRNKIYNKILHEPQLCKKLAMNYTIFGKMEGEREEEKMRKGNVKKWKGRENLHPSCCLVMREFINKNLKFKLPILLFISFQFGRKVNSGFEWKQNPCISFLFSLFPPIQTREKLLSLTHFFPFHLYSLKPNIVLVMSWIKSTKTQTIRLKTLCNFSCNARLKHFFGNLDQWSVALVKKRSRRTRFRTRKASKD